MAKKIICFTVSLIIVAGILLSCSGQQKPSQGSESETDALIPFNELDVKDIDIAVASAIKNDYFKQYQRLTNTKPEDVPISAEELAIVYYAGNYSGCEIVSIYDGLDETDAERPVEIAGYVIVFGGSDILWAYQDHSFYTIKEAYDSGLITKDDVYAIGTKIGFRQD